MALTTDQKVGGSSPSERAEHLDRLLPDGVPFGPVGDYAHALAAAARHRGAVTFGPTRDVVPGAS